MRIFIPVMQNVFQGRCFDCKQITDDGFTVSIELEGSDAKLTLVFDGALVVRRMDEGDMLRTLPEIGSTGGAGKMLYMVENSPFLNWFVEESCHTRSAITIKHFLVAGINTAVDVISFDEPKIIK
ncbi:hypothetical protein ACKI2N_023545 [Cupriavidus sp. 30B13]|uniref:hypothetical protein n=1 Tax=Cupriavidus sp. 30B13 TaxID=3384241 RepID=UPI003B91AE0D